MFEKLINFVNKLKQLKWTHIIVLVYSHLYLFFLYALIYDLFQSSQQFSLGFSFVLYTLFVLPYLAIFSLFVVLICNILSIKNKNINLVKNRFLLDNKIYNILWILCLVLFIYSIYFLFCSIFSFLF